MKPLAWSIYSADENAINTFKYDLKFFFVRGQPFAVNVSLKGANISFCMLGQNMVLVLCIHNCKVNLL